MQRKQGDNATRRPLLQGEEAEDVMLPPLGSSANPASSSATSGPGVNGCSNTSASGSRASAGAGASGMGHLEGSPGGTEDEERSLLHSGGGAVEPDVDRETELRPAAQGPSLPTLGPLSQRRASPNAGSGATGQGAGATGTQQQQQQQSTPLQSAAASAGSAATGAGGLGGLAATDEAAVELRQYSPPALGEAREALSSGNPAAPSPPAGASGASPTSEDDLGPPGERHCFICLDGDKDFPLVRCCSTCYACTHTRCWREWRNSQRLTALRSRLLGLRMQNTNLLRCTICKSGTAVLAGEEGGLQWMNELLNSNGENRQRPTPAPGAGHDSDDNDYLQFDDLVDMRTCMALLAYVALLLLVVIVACVLIITQRFYAGDVVLCCTIALYELSVLQVVALTIGRRRGTMLAAAQVREEASGGQGGFSLEMQLQARDVPLPASF